ncbi:winged helix-turn-helix domain-containing protein [Micromonospora haikouensis]|uniref:response regulator transcription factor n=1 Tax=Micromonospora haikouensis TaxID=686309 RepID=UPI00379D257C
MTQGTVRVLVVEGRAVQAEARRQDLRRQGYVVSSVDSGAKAMQAHRISDFVLLDLDLPDIDGIEVCRSIRATGSKPIITVSSGDTETDRVLALNAGADDCLDAGCGPREMLARIEAVLRRSLPCRQCDRVISLGSLSLDGQSHEARLRGQPVKLTGREFELLHKLASHPDEVLSRKQLMASVWGTSWADASRTIDTHVRSLRAKLGARSWIITVRGVGYRIGRG